MKWYCARAPSNPDVASALQAWEAATDRAVSLAVRSALIANRGIKAQAKGDRARSRSDFSSVHVRPVVDGRFAVRLPGHEHEARPALRIVHGHRSAGPENRNLGAPRPASGGADVGLALQHVREAVEVGWNRAAEGSARWQLDVQDEPRSPEFD